MDACPLVIAYTPQQRIGGITDVFGWYQRKKIRDGSATCRDAKANPKRPFLEPKKSYKTRVTIHRETWQLQTKYEVNF